MTQPITPESDKSLNRFAEELRLAAGQPEASVVLGIDQAEELLADDVQHEAEPFLALLRASLEYPATPLITIAALRSDWLGRFQTHSRLLDLPFENVLLGPLPKTAFREIIEEPARLHRLQLEPGLADAIIADCGTDTDVLPILAYTLRELYDRYGRNGWLRITDYAQALGGIGGAIERRAEEVVNWEAITEEELTEIRRVLVQLARPNEGGRLRAVQSIGKPCLSKRVLVSKLLSTHDYSYRVRHRGKRLHKPTQASIASLRLRTKFYSGPGRDCTNGCKRTANSRGLPNAFAIRWGFGAEMALLKMICFLVQALSWKRLVNSYTKSH